METPIIVIYFAQCNYTQCSFNDVNQDEQDSKALIKH